MPKFTCLIHPKVMPIYPTVYTTCHCLVTILPYEFYDFYQKQKIVSIYYFIRLDHDSGGFRKITKINGFVKLIEIIFFINLIY